LGERKTELQQIIPSAKLTQKLKLNSNPSNGNKNKKIN
jgi:hypothetical protein